MSIFKCTQVAFFQRLGSQGQNMPLETMLDGIKGNRWAGQIKRLRSKERDAPDYAKLKTALPAFMLSGTTNGGHKAADFAEHSGLLQIDLDDIGKEEAGNLRDKISKDTHILACWISPSGDGVKAIMLIPNSVTGHRAAFAAAACHMKETYGVEIDPKCSDVSRLCFVSHDPAIVLNPAALPLQVPDPVGNAAATSPPHSSALLNSESTSCILHLHNSPFFEDFPKLRKHYVNLVAKRFGDVQPGMRNAVLVEIVSTCFCAVAPEVVAAFANEFYQQNQKVFADYPLERWQAETRNLIEGCTRSYPGRLTAGERIAYNALGSESQRAAFRICQSLACIESDESTPPPLFFMSYEALGIRINELCQCAARTLQKLQTAGIIAIHLKGQQRAKNVTAKATIWRWML
jgi:hypothetical protein